MNGKTILLIAAGVGAIYLLTRNSRPGTATFFPGTRPATGTTAPGTSARAQIENAAGRAASQVIGRVADKAGEAASSWFDSIFAERPAIVTYDNPASGTGGEF